MFDLESSYLASWDEFSRVCHEQFKPLITRAVMDSQLSQSAAVAMNNSWWMMLFSPFGFHTARVCLRIFHFSVYVGGFLASQDIVSTSFWNLFFFSFSKIYFLLPAKTINSCSLETHPIRCESRKSSSCPVKKMKHRIINVSYSFNLCRLFLPLIGKTYSYMFRRRWWNFQIIFVMIENNNHDWEDFVVSLKAQSRFLTELGEDFFIEIIAISKPPQE